MRRTTLGLIVVAACTAAAAAQNLDDAEIKTHKVAGGVSMLEGRGGNIGVCVGTDGVFMIDDQFAPLTEKILAAVTRLSKQPVEFLVNTHWHGDHTGGNENLGKGGTVIVAHENVRRRMSTEQFMKAFNRTTPPSPKAALPVVTFSESVTFHYNDEEIHVFHLPHAHTDGDAAIQFRNANVLHLGDVFFSGMYPFIDTSSGGSIDGLIDAVERIRTYVDEKTKIIPGHGPLSTKRDLTAYHDMLVVSRDAVGELIRQGRSLEQIQAARPLAEVDEQWGTGFITPERWLAILHDSLTAGGR